MLPAVRMAISSEQSRRRLSGQMEKGNATNTQIDTLHVRVSPRGAGLAPRLVILASFPHGLTKTKSGLVVGKGTDGSGSAALRWDLPRAAVRDWGRPLAHLLQRSGPDCAPLLSPAGMEGVQVAVCPQVSSSSVYSLRFDIGKKRKSFHVSLCACMNRLRKECVDDLETFTWTFLQDLETVLQWLTNHPIVHFVAPVPKITASNLFAGIVSQTGSWNSSQGHPLQAFNMPFWRMGLDGTGQVCAGGCRHAIDRRAYRRPSYEPSHVNEAGWSMLNSSEMGALASTLCTTDLTIASFLPHDPPMSIFIIRWWGLQTRAFRWTAASSSTLRALSQLPMLSWTTKRTSQ